MPWVQRSKLHVLFNQLYFVTLRPDTEEAFLPEGPEGPEIDVSVPLTRQLFETAAADVLKRLKELLTEALEFKPEAFELLGGGSRIPGVQTRASQLKQTKQGARKDTGKMQKRCRNWSCQIVEIVKFKINGSTSPTGPNWAPFTLEIFGLGWSH